MSTKIKVAILAGGDTEERVVSVKSAGVVHKYLHGEKYDARIIDINGREWIDLDTGHSIDKNDFSLDLGGSKWKPEVVFCAIHGAPMENGIIQGYFDILGIPYTCCDGFVSGLTMNKSLTKRTLQAYDIPMAREVLVTKAAYREGVDTEDIIAKLGLPLFVKPNAHGSSFGVRKVKNIEELIPAIEYAFQFDQDVMVESMMAGREFGNGVMRINGEIVVLPVTEIIPLKEFFDFEAKYEGASREVTPAEISSELERQVKEYTSKIYTALNCSGFVRVDYILVGDTFHLIEVNTVPGLSEASIIPQQAIAHGWTLNQFFDLAVSEALREKS
ncbi:MAG: D-alanine--D-alanine ligase [Saprospiraceae bacterium]|nr:D-alanine--D-alanine ligase [Candidatus Parvibacillus calidus]MBX2937260.1 D-alanine--D-alanine ligase [Saprospiraceae bacterium]MBX7180253.1 D-alanine--D-alanine ligase [Saprospiraceae bacterium]MCB0592344.1 D-alanine--D-alanine ligase [Saprospiraceae bacterium]MCO5284112.1 D-alanine--D-alanine ligase [Saprospiraceae bacterium]